MYLSSDKMRNPVDMINFSINGISHTVSVAEYSNHSLASYVREVAGLTGTKVGILKKAKNKQTNKHKTNKKRNKQMPQTNNHILASYVREFVSHSGTKVET